MAGRVTAGRADPSGGPKKMDQREAKSHWSRESERLSQMQLDERSAAAWTSPGGHFKQSDKVTSHNTYECMDLCSDGDDLGAIYRTRRDFKCGRGAAHHPFRADVDMNKQRS